MKAVLALLLGLVSIAISDDTDDGEAFSWDSSDTDATESYNGLVVQVYNPTDGEPVITLGTDLDDHESTYCLTLIRIFEATGYDLTWTMSIDEDYTEVSGSSVDLSDASCEVTETTSTTFSISCSDVNGATLAFAFQFVTNADTGDEGLEYTITLNDYTFTQDDAQLVLVQSVKECSDTYAYSADSGEESEDTDDTTDDDTTATRRRLLDDDEDDEDTSDTNDDTTDDDTTDDDTSTDTDTSTDDDDTSDSADEESGISSDDSNEYDSGYTQFIVNGQAYDDCDGTQTAIDSGLVYDEEDEELHVVFSHFDCNLLLDPYFGVDNSKLDSGVSGVYVMIGSMIGLVGALLF